MHGLRPEILLRNRRGQRGRGERRNVAAPWPGVAGPILSRPRRAAPSGPRLGRPAHKASNEPASGHGNGSVPVDIDFLSLLAHQLLAPLACIDAAAQRLMRQPDAMDAEDVRARAGRIRTATEQVSGLVRSMMDRAKAGAACARFEPRECNLRQILSRVCEQVHCAQPARQILIALPQPAECVAGDPLLLEQLLAILVFNAAKYSSVNAPIEVTGVVQGRELLVRVADFGIGVPAHDVPHLFTPLFRSRNAADYPGSGLGLCFGKHIAALHGGSIAVESQEGMGSTFTVNLPLGR